MKRLLLIISFLLAWTSAALAHEKIPDGQCRTPEDRRHNTDWFSRSGWGIFVHYLWDIQNAGNHPNNMGKTTDWNTCVNEFDTEKFADQVKKTGAHYVIFTMMQRTRYLIAPNDTYDKLTAYKPGEACSTRDLVEDLYQSLHKRDIVLMLYWTGDGPRQDPQAAKGMGYGPGTPVQFVKNWAAVAAEYGERYKEKVAGYWVDGCYGGGAANTGYNEEKWTIIANGLRAGNPRRIIALNSPSMVTANSYTLNDDYTTGETNNFGEVPDTRWRDGVQWHVLSFLGPQWATPGVRYQPNYLVDYVGAVNDAGGVISIDVALFRDGSIDPKQVEALKQMSAGLRQRVPEPLPANRAPVPPGNLACWKPARLLSVDGSRVLPVNGGGGKLHLARYGVDGNAQTDAQAADEYAWTYQVDLQKETRLGRVAVTFGKNGYATDFRIDVSIDGNQWTGVYEKHNHDGGKMEASIAPTVARYIRLVGLKPDGAGQRGGQMQVAELEAYAAN